MKFSVIVPVYNVENYIEDCLKSILKQSYDNFEVIVVNDGSTDNTLKVIEKVAKTDKRITVYDNENKGVSYTRNYGISKAKGEYFIFVDSDDTINEDLLKVLNDTIKDDDIDLVKYQIQMIDGNNIKFEETKLFNNVSGEEAFMNLWENDLFVTPVTYAYRTKYFKDNKFTYAEGRVHEDYGLTPLVVIKADKVSAINYVGYNYYVRENSIMTSNSIDRIKAKNDDSLYHFDYLIKEADKLNISDRSLMYFKSYLANGLINRCKIMDDNLLNDYVKELTNRNIYKYMVNDSIGRKVKRIIFKLCPMFYINKFVK